MRVPEIGGPKLAASRLVFCALMLAFGVLPADAATSEDGRRAYDAAHFTDAMGIWAELSRQGNPEAEFGLGLLYDLGNGTPESPETAFFWYRMAADAGLPAAQFNIGAMYDSGRGVAQSSKDAALWYARAAVHGHHRAQFDLGLLYAQGDGIPANSDAAAAWLRKAADGGLPAAAARLKALEATAPARPGGSIVSVTLAAPTRDANLTLSEGHRTVELVWIAPLEPQPVHYEIQVRELGGPTLRTVFTASVAETAALIQLPSDTDFYVWNVDVVGRDGSHAAGDWSWFSVGPQPHSERSVAAAPRVSQPDR